MGSGNKFLPWVVLIVFFVCFQALFVVADSRQTAPRTAEAFIKAYYAMDPAMSDMVCRTLRGDDDDPVTRFIEDVASEADALGHNLNYMRSQLLTLHTQTVSETDNSAVVHITGTRKRCIHPVFTFIARLPLLSLGDTFAVEKTLKLVKEDGHWRVCNDIFTPVDVHDIYGRSG